jgi:hypothetical protein
MTYFEAKSERNPELSPMQDEDPFIGGLTVAAFFALSDSEQAHVWDQAYQSFVAAHDLGELDLGRKRPPGRATACRAG